MASSRLDSLFASEGFKKDLPGILALPPEFLDSIIRLLESQDRIHPERDLDAVAERLNISNNLASGAFALSLVLATEFGAKKTTSEEVQKRFVSELGMDRDAVRAFAAYMEKLAPAGTAVERIKKRHSLLTEGGKTVGAISVVCDLRVQAKELSAGVEIDAYEPEISELVPLAIVKVSFAHADDGDDSVFQLTPSEVREFIRGLQAVAKQMDEVAQKVRVAPANPNAQN